MNFFQKRDYLSMAVFMLIFLAFTFGAREVSDSMIVEALAGGLGAIVGYFLSSYTSSKSKPLRVAVLAGVIVLSFTSLYLLSSFDTISKLPTGAYITDSSDDIVIKLRVEDERAFLSMSPEFEEVEYIPELRNDSLYMFKDDELIFEWEVLHVDDKSLVIGNEAGEKLEFAKQNL